MQDNPLNLHAGMDSEIPEPAAFSHAAVEWISEADRTRFAQGSLATNPYAKDDAYKALAMSDQISSPFGLDAAQPKVVLADVRSQPPNQDAGYHTDEPFGDLPNMTAVIHTLMLRKELITQNRMIYLIVDNRKPESVPHWPAFAAWWASRKRLVGPQEEKTEILWICADNTTGLGQAPY